MEISEYLPMFLAEGREHLQELNLAVVRIEERPDDQDTVDEIFRIAHSLKGMSATMGFAGMAALTHEMEDVFELLRQRKGGLSREAIDVLLECLDALSAAVDAIDESGEEEIQPEPLIARLQGLIRERDAVEPPAQTSAAPADLAELADGRRVVQVSATLSDDVQLPAKCIGYDARHRHRASRHPQNERVAAPLARKALGEQPGCLLSTGEAHRVNSS